MSYTPTSCATLSQSTGLQAAALTSLADCFLFQRDTDCMASLISMLLRRFACINQCSVAAKSHLLNSMSQGKTPVRRVSSTLTRMCLVIAADDAHLHLPVDVEAPPSHSAPPSCSASWRFVNTSSASANPVVTSTNTAVGPVPDSPASSGTGDALDSAESSGSSSGEACR